ncbi:PfkB family carbohydrate kinase [Alphaproteobacteria bacterium]|nr:PfkB family carbohydrate kinase [Alphaproteobacteria bacterium]MDC1121551.1 PfkB family carbohydrate kinase [Alphaproteobacteria bacterium]
MVDELRKNYQKKIISIDNLVKEVGPFGRKKTIVMCHGVFDVVHPGHIRHLAYAKSKADILVVSVTCDRWIKKGPYRPHVPEDLRALSLAAFDMVDYVLIDHNEKPLQSIKTIQPDLFAKGFEYSDNLPKTTIEEIGLVKSYGGETIFTPGDVVYSSTNLINAAMPDLRVDKLKSMMDLMDLNFDLVEKTVRQLTGVKVHVVGDTIVDSYTRTSLIGGNTKTPTFSVLFNSREDYVGGAGVVSLHLKAAGADVTFTTMLGDDELGQFAANHLIERGVKLNAIVDNKRSTTNKNAIICGNHRLLKLDTLDNASISPEIVERFKRHIASEGTDCLIFSDFRHGIFNKGTISNLVEAAPKNIMKIADSQLASRWGNITEFKNFDLVTPNEREARFAVADQDCNIGNLAHQIREASASTNVILKLGAKGLFFLGENIYNSIDSFTNNVRDAVGSGDALLAYATLTMKVTGSLPLACIIGSLAAACECEIDGNEPITPDLILAKLKDIKQEMQSG